MFNRKSSYALNKKDPNAIVYMDANEAIIRLTREDFASEEEFLKWKSWSDGNYHTEDNQDVVEGKHNTSIDDLSEAALSIASRASLKPMRRCWNNAEICDCPLHTPLH